MRGIITRQPDTTEQRGRGRPPADESRMVRSRRELVASRVAPATALVALALALVFGFTALYVTAFHDPNPHGVKIGMVGSARGVEQASSALDRAMPGGFSIARYDSQADARTALRDADVHGVVVLSSRSDTVLVAGAFGFAPTAAITAAAQRLSSAGGRPLTVHDLSPLPRRDSRGLASFFTVFGTVVPSIAFGVLLALGGARLPARARWPMLIIFAICAGLVAAVSVDTVVGALRGHFWAVAAVACLLALAVASTVHGLRRLAGRFGIAAGALLLVLVGQSSSGGALTFELEPPFYGAVSQLLPNGAALSAMRNSVYFHGAHTLVPLLVLGAWAVAGIALGLAGESFTETVTPHEGRQSPSSTTGPTPAPA